MKWLGASGAIVAGLILAGVGTRLILDGGAAAMDRVPWGLILLVVLMASLTLAGISLFARQAILGSLCPHLGDFRISPGADVAADGVW